MAFVRTRTINGKPYRYLEYRWREGDKVRSKSVYLGPGSSGGGSSWLPQPIPQEQRGWTYIERLMEKYPGDPFEAKREELDKAAAAPTAATPSTNAPQPGQDDAASSQPSGSPEVGSKEP